eukprot:TRINITY_DN3167_c1_g1_i1.p1 TRINITY_DN3167_c1_g1~~TRINITY_DN3167_c1_g1_i1.p1  ORF type:complete len:480 (+),score=149.13 TRINITY_DN3167_c1_g1_i1:58-1497(+)
MLLTLLTTAALAASKPNIVWIMADDMGWGEVGLYPAGSIHGRIATPNLDTFGKEGMVFTNAYAGYTVCAPSRTTLFTGRHSGNFKKYGYPGTTLPVDMNVTTTAHLLQKAGYATVAVGKIAPLVAPIQQGFDHFIGQIDQTDAHNMYPVVIDAQTTGAPFHVELPLNNKTKNRSLCMAHPSEYNYTIDVFQDNGIMYLEQLAKGGKPFFLYLSFTVPHAGGWTDTGAEQGAPVPTDLQYAPQIGNWPDVEVDHAAVITYMDKYVGDVMAKLKALNIDDDTIVFFASDNGAHLEGGHSYKFFNSTGGLNGHKRSLYEGGVRSPTMVRWPGKVPPSTSDFQWAFWDVMPTLNELAQGSPNDLPADIDGVSIVPTLMGQSQDAHEYVYFTWDGAGQVLHTPEMWKGSTASGYGVRSGKWKGVVPYCNDTAKQQPSMNDAMQLYDLDADPFETTDVSSANPNEVEALKKLVISKDLTCNCYQC